MGNRMKVCSEKVKFLLNCFEKAFTKAEIQAQRMFQDNNSEYMAFIIGFYYQQLESRTCKFEFLEFFPSSFLSFSIILEMQIKIL